MGPSRGEYMSQQPKGSMLMLSGSLKKLAAHGCYHLNQLSTSRVKVINVCFHFLFGVALLSVEKFKLIPRRLVANGD